MKFEELLAYDSDLILSFQHSHFESFDGITVPEHPKRNHIVFVKDLRFFEILKKEVNKNLEIFKTMALIIDKKFYESKDEVRAMNDSLGAVVLSEHLKLSLAKLSAPFYKILHEKNDDFIDGRNDGSARIHQSARISPFAFIGQNVEIGQNVVIHPHVSLFANCKIGEGSILYPNVTLYRNVIVGRQCRIHASTVLGADGFGYEFHQGVHLKIWHTGGVILEDNVEIGAASAIDSGTFTPTLIGAGTKIDNHVQVGHNGKVGKGVIMCGQVGVSGSAAIGDYVVLGGKAGVGPDVEIGKASQIAGNAMVGNDCPEKSILAGHPARPLNEWMRGLAFVRRESLKK